jgi:uncharacterized protein (DUF58 family)
MNRRVHPARPLAPIAVGAAVILTWWVVAHNGGSGWVQTLGDVVFATLVIGILGPSVALARARLRIVTAPADGTAGTPIELRADASARLRLRLVEPAGPETFIGPVRKTRRAASEVTLIPTRRGVYDALVVDVATAAPFGFQWWTRRMVLPLPGPLYVAPRRGEPVTLPVRGNEESGEASRSVPAELGEPRGVRPYRPGDVRRHVHWPATAHSGELMVREMEGRAAEPIEVTVTLPRDPSEAEGIAERAMGTVLRLLDNGAEVVLATLEPGGAVTGLVADRRAAGRRLARAVAAPGRPSPDVIGITVSP